MEKISATPILVPNNNSSPTKVGLWKHCKTNQLSLWQDVFSVDKNWYGFDLNLISIDQEENLLDGDLVLWGDKTLCRYSFDSINKTHDAVVLATNELFPFSTTDYLNKVITTVTHDQISPEDIQKFIEQYNSNNMFEDVDIEIEVDNEPTTDGNYEKYKTVFPKLTNGFITIVEDEVIGYPLDYYIRQKHSQDRCMGFIDGYNARKAEEKTLYNDDEVEELLSEFFDRHTNAQNANIKEWFNNNKKK
jgi:hypothetical protein